jgi:hypothetical protein
MKRFHSIVFARSESDEAIESTTDAMRESHRRRAPCPRKHCWIASLRSQLSVQIVRRWDARTKVATRFLARQIDRLAIGFSPVVIMVTLPLPDQRLLS